MSASDDELLDLAQRGDREAWNLLVERHAPRIAAYIGARLRRPEVVDTIVAESIFYAWRHIDDCESGEEVPAWFRRIAAKLALRWHSKHKGESLVADFPVERCAGDTELERSMTALEAALGKLPEPMRMALEQRFRGRLQGEALAEALHKEPAEAEAAVEEAMAKLNDLLDQD